MLYPFGAVFLAVIMAPFTEEFIYRYMVLGGMLRTIAPRKAILISALLFSALHLNIWQAPVTFIMGLLIGWTYYRTRSLGLSIAMHAVHNGFVISLPVIDRVLSPNAVTESDEIPAWLLGFPLIAIATALVVIGVSFLNRRTTTPVDVLVPA